MTDPRCALGNCLYDPHRCPWGDGDCARLASQADGER